MPKGDFAVVYCGNIVQVDFLKSLLEGSGIQCVLQYIVHFVLWLAAAHGGMLVV